MKDAPRDLSTARVPRRWWQQLLMAGMLVALAPVLGRALPGAFNQYHCLVLAFGVTYALAALPVNLLMGYAGQISLGHAAFLGIGSYTSGIIAGRLGLPFLAGMALAALLGGASALIIGLPALRIRGLYLTLVTLGFGLAMSSLVFRLRSVTGGYAGVSIPRPQVGTYVFIRNADLLAILVAVLVLVWVLDRNVMGTKVGRAFLALRRDEEVAAAFGIDVAFYKIYAFVLYGALSGVAGSILGHVVGFAQVETFTFDLSMLFVVIVVIGGLGSRPGVATAAFLFGVAPRFFGFLRGWDLMIAPLMVVYTLVRHPGGLSEVLAEMDPRMRRLRRLTSQAGATDATEGVAAPVSLALPRPVGANPGESGPAVDGFPLEVRNVSVRFGGVAAVDDVSFVVEAGTITGLIGPNGAGKTTLFNAVSGFVRPSGGQILLRGHDVSHDPPHRRAALGLGRTFQQIGLIKDLSVTENLVLAQHRFAAYGSLESLLKLPRVLRQERLLRGRAADVLATLGFERFADAPLGSLSHGQQRIVELACALLTAPGVLLLDEPSAGMSPAAAEALAQRLIQVRDEFHQTTLLIEHHLPFVMATCAKVHVLDAGRLLMSGPPDEVRRDPTVVAAYLGERVA